MFDAADEALRSRVFPLPERYEAEAGNILSHRVRVLGHEYRLGDSIDWHRDYRLGRNCPIRYSSFIDLKDPEFKRHYEDERQALKLAIKIAALREQKGLSQQELAKRMGTSQQAISRIESGEYEGFTLKTLEKIAEATGMKVKIDFVAA